YVLVGLGVMHDKIAALLDHLRKVFERHITAGRRVVEAPVGVFLDDDRLGTGGLFGPGCIHARSVPAWRQCCSATIARFMPISAINRTAYGANTGPPSALRPIIAAMTDADELARRYLSLWTEYLTALVGDPRALEMLKRWLTLTGQFSYPSAGSSPAMAAPFPAWPPFFAPFGPPVPPPAERGGTAQAE